MNELAHSLWSTESNPEWVGPEWENFDDFREAMTEQSAIQKTSMYAYVDNINSITEKYVKFTFTVESQGVFGPDFRRHMMSTLTLKGLPLDLLLFLIRWLTVPFLHFACSVSTALLAFYLFRNGRVSELPAPIFGSIVFAIMGVTSVWMRRKMSRE